MTVIQLGPSIKFVIKLVETVHVSQELGDEGVISAFLDSTAWVLLAVVLVSAQSMLSRIAVTPKDSAHARMESLD